MRKIDLSEMIKDLKLDEILCKAFAEKSTAFLLAIAPFCLKRAFAIKFVITFAAISNNSF